MALLTTNLVTRAGIASPAGVAPTATVGDTFQPGDKVWLRVKTTGTATNVTVTSQQLGPEGQNTDPPAVAVGATAEMVIGPYPAARFGGANGLATVICSGALTGVTVACLSLGA